MKQIKLLAIFAILILPSSISYKQPFHYYSYKEMEEFLNEMEEEYPEIMKFYSIGKTYGGREIYVVKISDNVSIDENEAEVLFMGAHHGNEKLGYQFLLYFIKSMCENYSKNESVAYLINNAEIFVVPMVNPDGVKNNTRKNVEPNNCIGENIFPILKGVNLNRNYDAGWNEWRPWYFLSTTSTPYGDLILYFLGYPPEYRGEKPFSERETKAIKNFVESRNITIAIDFHTGAGKIIFYPFGYTDKKKPKDLEKFISIAENISSINGYDYAEAGEGVIGMAIDWLYEKHGIYALIIELTRNVAPRDAEEVREIIQLNLPVMHYIINRAIEEKGRI